MTEWKLFEGDVPYVSTAEFHADRERAPHLEQEFHQERLYRAATFVHEASERLGSVTVSDLGCGDGGLLSLVQGYPEVTSAWGYDFAPANIAGWAERGVVAYALNVFGENWDPVDLGDIIVMTEVLEHLANPHGVLQKLARRAHPRRLVCSSPWNENQNNHCAEHAWAWNLEGYAAMIQNAGWNIIRHEQAGMFQVILAE